MFEIEYTLNGTTTVIDFDISKTERYTSPATVTEHAVERGAPVSDGVIAGNDTIAIEGIVSNTPVFVRRYGMDGATMSESTTTVTIAGQQRTVTVFQASQPFDRVRAIDTILQSLRDTGQELTLRTSFREISPVVIESYEGFRDATTGKSLPVTLTFRRVRIVSTQRVAVSAARQRRHQSTQNRGTQPTTTPTEARASLLQRAVDYVTQNTGAQ